ncbi:hypothetical protein VNO77_25547 [Canavalia gladiata]|uniref:Uncharacterized protein n=1 Tax=Canavalia gladiata TaxID=3824 RepID=A0AAN9QB07_CANGL
MVGAASKQRDTNVKIHRLNDRLWMGMRFRIRFISLVCVSGSASASTVLVLDPFFYDSDHTTHLMDKKVLLSSLLWFTDKF